MICLCLYNRALELVDNDWGGIYTLKGALILPAFNEAESIYNLLHELDLHIPNNWHLIVIDDSPTDATKIYVRKAFSELRRDKSTMHLVCNSKKSGRGAAVQQGFAFAISNLDFQFIIEMDSDGSHTYESVISLMKAPIDQDFVIGSRYLKNSTIAGWPLFRRAFSRATNLLLKKIFGIRISDWTNGLRRYSTKAIEIQVNYTFKNNGFICLTEQILLLHDHEIFAFEVPINFVDRKHGASTVTHMEILKSLKGIAGLYKKWK
jgi:dolichol-phosphate mannosyltransferase